MICPNCEAENKEGAKFCNECGFPLTGRIATVAAATTNDEALRALEGLEASGDATQEEGAALFAQGGGGYGEEAFGKASEADSNEPSEAQKPDSNEPSESGAEDEKAEAPAPDEGLDDKHERPDAAEGPSDEESAAEGGGRPGEGAREKPEAPEDQPSLSDLPDPARAVPDARAGAASPPANEASGPLDRASLPAIDVAGVNVDENGRAFDFGPIEDGDEVEGPQDPQASDRVGEAPADDDLSPFIPRHPEASQHDQGRNDLSGFDECLVDAGYVPPQKSWRSGDTMEMPRIEDQDPQPRRVLRAADPHDKKGRKEKRKSDKQAQKAQKAEQKQQKKAQRQKGGDGSSSSPKRRRGRKLLVAIVLLLLAGAVAAGVTYHYELWGGKMLPNVVGMTQADASDILEGKGFTVRETKVKSDETEGIVLLMDPGAGAREEEGSEVTIHVSQARTVPDVVGLQRDDAAARFADEGFENVAFDEQKSDEQEGSVLGVDPAAGQKAQAKTPVTVTVAVPYTVPDVSGMSYDQAKAAIEQAGLVSQLVYSYNDKVAEGSILGTDPAAGTKVASGSTVSVSVARSRANELVAAAQSYLASAGTININGSSYLIQSVDAVSYQGKDTTAFTITAAAVTTLDGETVHGSYKQRNGAIVWNSSNKIVSIS